MIPTIDPGTAIDGVFCTDIPHLLNSEFTPFDCLAIRWEVISTPNNTIVQPEDVFFSNPNGFLTYVSVPYPGNYCFSAVCIKEA